MTDALSATLKVCTSCGQSKPATPEHYPPTKRGAGPRNVCKVCSAARLREYRRANRDKFAEYERKRRASEKRKAYNQRRRDENRDHFRALARQWRAAHQEQHRAHALKSYHANRERIVGEQAKYRAAHREKLRAHAVSYRAANKTAISEKGRTKRSLNKQDPRWRAAKAISTSMLQALRKQKDGRMWETLAGYTREQLVRHLERQFMRGMSWANHGTKWHIDHIRPVSSFTFGSADEIKACWALTNLRPLWKSENLAKHARRTHLI